MTYCDVALVLAAVVDRVQALRVGACDDDYNIGWTEGIEAALSEAKRVTLAEIATLREQDAQMEARR